MLFSLAGPLTFAQRNARLDPGAMGNPFFGGNQGGLGGNPFFGGNFQGGSNFGGGQVGGGAQFLDGGNLTGNPRQGAEPEASYLDDGRAQLRLATQRASGDGRSKAVEIGKELADRLGTAAVIDAATAGKLGDFFQYAIDHPVSLARQKSALLPIVGKDVEGTRVSIYNPAVQAKHPLLGLRFKNTSGVHLSQGPITVFEGSTYAGDARVLDVQPAEERLISYAIDLGTEVDPQDGPATSRLTRVRAVKGVVVTTSRERLEKRYRVANRSQADRTLVIEHPNSTGTGYKLVDTPPPVEDTKDVYRFQLAVKAGEQATFVVAEERDVNTRVVLSNDPVQQIRYVMSLTEAPAELKAKLAEAMRLKATWDGQLRDLTQVKAELARVASDQDRIRRNLSATPREAEVYQTYLRRLADQEREIDGLTAREKSLTATEFAARKAFEDCLANVTD